MSALWGREGELARVNRFVEELSDGPAAMVVEGEPGVGKTTLVEAVISNVPAAVTVLRARCTQAESTLGYVGLGDLIGLKADELLATLPPPQRAAVETVLLRVPAGTASTQPHLIGQATLSVLSRLSIDSTVLVTVDDAQWMDAASARTLSFVFRRLGRLPVGVLVTRRTTRDPLPFGLDEGLPVGRCARIRLGPLADDDLIDMVEERLECHLPRAARLWLTRAAAGNPMYALELAFAHCSGAGIGVQGRSAALSTWAATVLPARLEELVAGRLERLPPVTVGPLAAVACLAIPTVAQVIAALGPPAAVGLDHALDAGIIRVDEGRIQFCHPLYGPAALDRVPPSARRALHARLAEVIGDPEQRADHLVRAADGPSEAVAAAAEAAASLARTRGAPEVAAELAEAAVRLTPTAYRVEACRRRVAAGYHRAAAGEIGAGRLHFVAAVDSQPPGPDRAEVVWRLAMLTYLDGDLSRAVVLLEGALAECRDRPALTATVAIKLAGMLWWQGRLAEALAHGRLALQEADRTGDPLTLLDALMLHVRTALAMSVDDPPALADRIRKVGPAVGRRAPYEDPELVQVGLDAVAGDYVAAAQRLERLYQRAVDEGEEVGIASIGGHLAEMRLILGNWQHARRVADEALRYARRTASPTVVAPALYGVALVDAVTGDLDAADTALTELLTNVEERGVVPIQLWGQAVAGLVALSRGDAWTAHARIGPVLERLDELGIREPAWAPLVWCDLDALVDLGDLEQAAALSDELLLRGRALDRPLALAIAQRCRARVSAARGDIATALAEFDRALSAHERVSWPFQHARTLLALGTVLHRAKQKTAARTALVRARTEFDRAGARLWAARTAAELARIGGRSRQGGLTATERRVAELVANGHSNAEVAATMFISTKTVAAHLTRVYAKLGVRSRGELTRHLARETSRSSDPT